MRISCIAAQNLECKRSATKIKKFFDGGCQRLRSWRSLVTECCSLTWQREPTLWQLCRSFHQGRILRLLWQRAGCRDRRCPAMIRSGGPTECWSAAGPSVCCSKIQHRQKRRRGSDDRLNTVRQLSREWMIKKWIWLRDALLSALF